MASLAWLRQSDLVLHEGDERRDDDGDAGRALGVEGGRQLVAERLAGAGALDDQRRPAAEDAHHGRLLARPERLVAEPPQHLVDAGRRPLRTLLSVHVNDHQWDFSLD